jgi:hypothetical protein
MQHSWTKDGVIHNFCLKCGMRKSAAAWTKQRCLYQRNQGPLDHNIKINKNQYPQCTKCETIASNYYYYGNPHTGCCYDGTTLVVPYIEIFNHKQPSHLPLGG